MFMENYLKRIGRSVTGDGASRIFGLDLMRSAAILLVLFSHGRHILEGHFGEGIKYFSVGGYLGVELFFVLSGFLIGGILIKTIDKKDTSYGFKDIKTFWIRRWFRTLPNYYLMLIINSIIVSLIAGHFIFNIKYVFFLQNFLKPIVDAMNFGQSWSLTIEEWFYILMPLIFFVFIKVKNLPIKKGVLLTIILILVVYPAFKFLYIYLANAFFKVGYDLQFSTLRSVTILRLDSLLYGVLFAYFNHFYQIKLNKLMMPLFLIGSLFFLFSTIIILKMIYMNTDKPGIYINIFLPSFTSMAVAFTLPFFNNLKQIKNKSFTQFITATSILSYSIYLIHWSLVIPFINNIQGNTLLLYALFWVLTYLLSIINYFYFEQKMTKLRDRF